MRLLLLEDDPDAAAEMGHHLRADGHLVEHHARPGDVGELRSDAWDVLLVSWQLSDGSGLAWVRALRRLGVATAVVVLGLSRPHAGRTAVALKAGADDCLLKPVAPALLCERVRAVRRRVAGVPDAPLRCGEEVELDLQRRDALRGGRHVALTAREWSLVEALALRRGRVVPKDELELLVHGGTTVLASNALEVHLSNLRSKLGRGVVRTVRSVGYRLGE